MIYTCRYNTPLGGVTIAGSDSAVMGLWFDGQKYYKDTLPAEYTEKNIPLFDTVKEWLDIYFSGKAPDFTPPLSLDGATAFRRDVWKILLDIPYGKTVTYGEIAAKMAAERGIEKMSAQAVGGAVGHNPVSVIIPCHRVVGAGGNLTGYAGGIDKKVGLLKSEGVDMSAFFVPKNAD